MGLTVLAALLVLLPACQRSRVRPADPEDLPAGLITLGGARDVQANTQGDPTLWLGYTVNAKYPAMDVVSELSERLSRIGWVSQRSLFETSPRGEVTKRSWSLQESPGAIKPEAVLSLCWHDSSGNVVGYEFRHWVPFSDPESQAPQVATPLRVEAVYLPAAAARKLRSTLSGTEAR